MLQYIKPNIKMTGLEIICKSDCLWQMSLRAKLRPMWSGYMQGLHKGDHQGPCSEFFLPMVDLTPNDPTCVRSTLEYITAHAHRHNRTPVVTFDQQLWWTATMVIEDQPQDSALRDIVLILGGFHTEMSFIGENIKVSTPYM